MVEVKYEVTRHEQPSGAVVYHRREPYGYWQRANEDGTCSGRVANISKVSQNDGDTENDNLIDWGSKLSCVGVERIFTDGYDFFGKAGEDIWNHLKRQRLTWRDIRNEAGRRGNVSHNVLQSLAEGTTPYIESGYDESVVGWWKARNLEPIYTEWVVYDPANNLAGRPDLMFHGGHRLTLADLKTSNYISNSFAVQLNLYAMAMKAAGFTAPDDLAIVKALENGAPALEIHVPLNPQWATTALATYRNGADIRSALSASRKAAGA